jgi:hypothetical protein
MRRLKFTRPGFGSVELYVGRQISDIRRNLKLLCHMKYVKGVCGRAENASGMARKVISACLLT